MMKTLLINFILCISFLFGTSLIVRAAVTPLTLSLTKDANAPLVAVNSVTVVSPSSADRYFKFIPAQSGSYSFVSNSGYDPYIYIYNASGTQLGYNDDGNVSFDFNLNISLVAGSIYYVGIGNNENNAILYVPIKITGVLTGLPEAITNNASLVTQSSATLNAEALANNGSTDVIFEYGTTTSYGSTTTATLSPLTGALNTAVSADITGLTPNTTYHFRVKAINAAGIDFGSDLTFTTQATSTAVDDDIDGTVDIYTRHQTVYLSLPEAAIVQVYDITGNQIKAGYYNIGNNSFEVNKNGIYVIKIDIDNHIVSKKIVIK